MIFHILVKDLFKQNVFGILFYFHQFWKKFKIIVSDKNNILLNKKVLVFFMFEFFEILHLFGEFILKGYIFFENIQKTFDFSMQFK